MVYIANLKQLELFNLTRMVEAVEQRLWCNSDELPA